MSHIFQRYFDRHGHFPRVVVSSGVQRITVELSPGYISIRTSSPHQAQVYITRSAFFELMRKLVPLARKWEAHEDFDVPAAMHEAYLFELSLLRQKRDLKKTFVRDPEKQSHRQRQRYLAAKARAQRRKS